MVKRRGGNYLGQIYPLPDDRLGQATYDCSKLYSEGPIAAGKQLERENPEIKFAIADESGAFLWQGNGALKEDAQE